MLNPGYILLHCILFLKGKGKKMQNVIMTKSAVLGASCVDHRAVSKDSRQGICHVMSNYIFDLAHASK